MHALQQATGKKANGVHFTPHELACFVARRILKAVSLHTLDSMKVLDPACGDGELLLAFIKTLPSEFLNKVTLIGVETDYQALQRARERLAQISVKHTQLENSDFLEIVPRRIIQPGLFQDPPKQNALTDLANIIIANPPYVRTQILGSAKAQGLAAAFDLTGHVDLYHAFLVAMTAQLAPHGILGVITSNRFLSTQGGSSIRAFMAREYDIIEIVDLGDTKLFEAAVLPAIFIGRKRLHQIPGQIPASQETSFLRIYENPHEKILLAKSKG